MSESPRRRPSDTESADSEPVLAPVGQAMTAVTITATVRVTAAAGGRDRGAAPAGD